MTLTLNERFPPRTAVRILIVVAVTLFAFVSTAWAQDASLVGAGLTEIEGDDGGGKNWALLIGINYAGRQDEIRSDQRNQRALPELKNATNDAKELKSVLTTYYHYDSSRVVLLTDDGENVPTYHRIRDEITNLHTKVGEEDSLLVFFAGHGFKQPLDQSTNGGKNVLLLPYDVRLHEGRPVAASTFGLPDEFFDLLKESKARHKLMILDCCYSGEIFNARGKVGFQSQSQSANRGDKSLQRESSFQAIASCRPSQKADDGRGGNSKFTTALLDGLKHLPARREGDRRVWANRLLAYMSPHFDESQRPDCRSLVSSNGEFCFDPKEASVFEEFILKPGELAQLRAMVVSRQGSWWFEEMPWFLPAIREQVMLEHENQTTQPRSAGFVDLIAFDDLKSTAQNTIKRNRQLGTEIERKRFEYAETLMHADSKTLRESMDRIERELSSLIPANAGTAFPTQKAAGPGTPTDSANGGDAGYSPQDIHFLAVIQHALGMRDEAKISYERAKQAYQDAIKGRESPPVSLRILSALCMADHGEFLRSKLREYKHAADEFEAARREIAPSVPAVDESKDRDKDKLEKHAVKLNREELASAFFRIFMLCKEADACLGVKHWDRANHLLTKAVDVATAFATGHFLEAHVHRRRAWAKIIQWRIQEAKCSFERSNQILHEQFLREARERGDLVDDDVAFAVADDESADRRPTLSTSGSVCQLKTRFKRIGPIFHKSQDEASKIAYLHNLHGIAMATRFQGDTPGAVSYYRALASEVHKALFKFWSSSADRDIEQQFVSRMINTQERLGDCNLFGNPNDRDLAEAFDDYRRALGFVHFNCDMVARARSEAALLYKQSLALSLPSSIQDTELALELCERADKVYQQERETAGGLWQALGQLTTRTVQLLDESVRKEQESSTHKSNAADDLRRTILAYRDEIGRTPHRDQLELCLFASNVLLMHAGKKSKYQTSADADLLLGFCRLALSTQEQVESSAAVAVSESRDYLRPYFDSVMRAKLRDPAPRTKELVEIHAEATLGRHYVKPNQSLPTLAMYTLGDACYLVMDLPHERGKCVDLSATYDIQAIQKAIQSSDQRLQLPRDIYQTLIDWKARIARSSKIAIDLRWQDPVNDLLTVFPLAVHSTDPDRVVVKKPDNTAAPRADVRLIGHFPFNLPSGFLPKARVIDFDLPGASPSD